MTIAIRLALAAVLLLAADARAADELLTGDFLQLSPRLLGVRSRDTTITLGGGPGSADDPTIAGGSLRVVSVEGDVFDETFPLPATGWRALKRGGTVTGWMFRASGSIRRVRVKLGKGLRVTGKGSFTHTLATNPSPVRAVLAIGGQQYCMSFGGTVAFTAGQRYLARMSTAPDICPLPYPSDTTWLCRPGMAANQCLVPNSLDATVVNPDLSTTVEPEVGAEDHPYDCFYIYPTVDLSSTIGNHLDVTDPTYVSYTLDPLVSQAARFNQLCRIFAPHYRQITFGTFGSPNAAQYLDIAYRDVLDAWRLYLKYQNGGRNVVIMGHSQGTFMTTRLLQEEFDPSPALRSKLIAALLIGGSVTVPQGTTIGGTFQNIPLCTTADETGCVIAYRSYAAGHPPTANSNNIGGPTMDVGCTNPAALGGSALGAFTGTYFPTHTNNPVFNIAPAPSIPTPFVKFPLFYSGRCAKDSTNHSYLQVSITPLPGDLRTNPVPFNNPVLSPAVLGTHILDYNWPTQQLLGLVQTKAAMMP